MRALASRRVLPGLGHDQVARVRNCAEVTCRVEVDEGAVNWCGDGGRVSGFPGSPDPSVSDHPILFQTLLHSARKDLALS